MKTVCIQIGNSDDKLTQREWAEFVRWMSRAVQRHADQQHFFGGSENYSSWQNVCWVVEIDEPYLPATLQEIAEIRTKYHQDSVAVLVGEAEFI